mmetsp:Transcript_49796/g.151546  ORF Transcript_49796/g.151546 Transcript_49796/m.151546 type:complete len:426 (-) Transcript_49796:1215-2492(-)
MSGPSTMILGLPRFHCCKSKVKLRMPSSDREMEQSRTAGVVLRTGIWSLYFSRTNSKATRMSPLCWAPSKPPFNFSHFIFIPLRFSPGREHFCRTTCARPITRRSRWSRLDVRIMPYPPMRLNGLYDLPQWSTRWAITPSPPALGDFFSFFSLAAFGLLSIKLVLSFWPSASLSASACVSVFSSAPSAPWSCKLLTPPGLSASSSFAPASFGLLSIKLLRFGLSASSKARASCFALPAFDFVSRFAFALSAAAVAFACSTMSVPSSLYATMRTGSGCTFMSLTEHCNCSRMRRHSFQEGTTVLLAMLVQTDLPAQETCTTGLGKLLSSLPFPEFKSLAMSTYARNSKGSGFTIAGIRASGNEADLLTLTSTAPGSILFGRCAIGLHVIHIGDAVSQPSIVLMSMTLRRAKPTRLNSSPSRPPALE